MYPKQGSFVQFKFLINSPYFSDPRLIYETHLGPISIQRFGPQDGPLMVALHGNLAWSKLNLLVGWFCCFQQKPRERVHNADTKIDTTWYYWTWLTRYHCISLCFWHWKYDLTFLRDVICRFHHQRMGQPGRSLCHAGFPRFAAELAFQPADGASPCPRNWRRRCEPTFGSGDLSS